MAHSSTLINLSSSSTMGEKGEWDVHFRWHSIRMFIIIATTMSSFVCNFDIFSKISSKVRIFEFFILESTLGIQYLCMDVFIKLYTRRFDCNKYLNPLLRGISYGQLLQTAYFSNFHGSFTADTMRFLTGALKEVPSWAVCAKDVNTTCVPIKDVLLSCTNNRTTAFHETSTFLYYTHYFTYDGNKATTSRIFVSAIVWLLTFFLSSATEETIVKTFGLCFIFRNISTLMTLIFLLFSTKNEALASFFEIVNATTETSWFYDKIIHVNMKDYVDIIWFILLIISMEHVCYSYGIGFLGMYDFGIISPYTMIDTASVFFLVAFTLLAFMRSWIVRTLYLVMTKCVDLDESLEITTHKLFYAVLPLTTEFMHPQKLYLFYLFANLALSLISFQTFMVSTMSKFLHYEFRVKHIYIVGILCAIGFGISVIFVGISTRRLSFPVEYHGISVGILVLYLSGFRSVIVMWLYGMKRFATDMHFWLGFQPTRFWTTTWAVIPIIFSGFLIKRLILLLESPQLPQLKDIMWLSITFLVVTGMQIKTIPRYLLRNNIIGLFIASKLYGPPDLEDRKRRQIYNEITRHRKCIHNCMVIDDWFCCDHDPNAVEINSTMSDISEEPSFTNIYQEAETDKSGDVQRNTKLRIYEQ